MDRRRELTILYSKVRRANVRAASELLQLATRELELWIRRHLPVPHCDLDVQEIATEAVEETLRRVEHIPVWPAAWMYARRIAERRIRGKKVAKRNRSAFSETLPDKKFSSTERQTEQLDTLVAYLSRTTDEEVLLFSSIWCGRPTLEQLAKELSVSSRTVYRKRRALRERIVNLLALP